MPSDDRILLHAHESVGRITLDRPAAINSVDLEMLTAVGAALELWRDDPEVDIVLLDGTGERGFCAGGDVRRLHHEITSGSVDLAERFFRTEYTLNAAIAEYPKPIVTIADGVTMGGGIGLSGHASVRIVTETSILAMPETRIGFTPDAGGSWLLARAPGRLGEHLALTSASMDAADAIHAGFADHLVRRDRIDELHRALETRADPHTPTELVMLFDETPPESPLKAASEWIDDAFSLDTVVEIVDRLRELADDPRWRDAVVSPASALAAIEQRSPTALAVTLAAVRSSRALPNLRTALEQEFRLVGWFATTQPDMLEGIRAQMVDKDREPRWNPATLAEVDEDIVGSAFTHEPPRPLFV